ncbi:MAG: hypothetical protein IJM17_09720 [Firmicutes bacterium]|nr:hypothetical protein [Bacillota bacterium]
MKQLIVLISTVILGIAIAAMVLGFRNDASKLAGTVSGQIDSMVTEFSRD